MARLTLANKQQRNVLPYGIGLSTEYFSSMAAFWTIAIRELIYFYTFVNAY